ncbi:MAG TPA: hypothetical protein VM639_10905 [Dongiaceae bacterium]|nr:hypothetical protein [Dongiaceae bacterium]
MLKFIMHENIVRYKAMLEIETAPVKRRTLNKLLAEEEAKQSASAAVAIDDMCLTHAAQPYLIH